MNDFSSTFAQINEHGQIDYASNNKGITPVFFIEPILDGAATEREGRTVYRDMERVRIYIAGDSLSAATHPVDAGIIARFRDAYTEWKKKKSGVHITGMPLSKWPIATPGMIKECEFLNIYSVEDLAAVSDANVSNLSEGRAVREKAIAWLKSATDGAAVMKYAAENERLRDDLKEAMGRIAALERATGTGPRPVGIAGHVPEPPWEPTKRIKKAKAARKSAWTPERRAEVAARFKAAREAKKMAEVELVKP